MGILGIDLGGTNVRIGLVENDSLVKVESFPTNKNGDAISILDDIYRLIDHFSNEKISAIGVGVPSVVNVEKGIVYDVQNIPSWKEVHLKDLLKKKFKIPVYINNDANCFVCGEKYFGKAKKYKNVLGLIIGTGLGAGIIINEELYAGKNCGAGEFGMIQFKDKSYEYYCSGQFFINKYHTTGEELFKRAENGEKKALKIFSEFGSNLGEAIKTIMYSLDPEIIILGGSVSMSFKYFKDKMYKSLNNYYYSRAIDKLEIQVSEIKNIAILGAASLCYNEVRNNGLEILKGGKNTFHDLKGLSSAYKKEKQLNELKSRFLSTSSHEFRTPLTTILTSSELLVMGGRQLSEEKYLEYIIKIQNSVTYMTSLLDDMLAINKTDPGKWKFNPSRINLYRFCLMMIEDANNIATPQHNIIFNYLLNDKYAIVDDKLLQHIISNLLSNAVKYSPDGGNIILKVTQFRSNLEFVISDRGIGISKRDQKNLFENFYRGKNTGNIQGTGLGLSIVKRSVESHGGQIKFKSRLNEGSTFSVLIPIMTEV